LLFACYCIFALWLCLLPLLASNPLTCCLLLQMHVISFLNHLIKLQQQFLHLLGVFVQVKHLEFGGCNSFMELFLQLKHLETSSCCCCWTVISKKTFPSSRPLVLLHAQHVYLYPTFLSSFYCPLCWLDNFSSKGLKAYFMCSFYDVQWHWNCCN
jgi:hypothetical protein